ncbi:MAG: helix-turn-helix domain-containing protein [Fimbriimonadaceae bacterium]|nr:helix-turn-helix domain-containing protein [Fimbriimonadaceae bacterium]
MVGDGFEPHDPSAEIPFNEVEEGEVIPANLRDEHRQALAALLEADCNQSEAARLLGLSETTFRRRLAALRRIIQAHLVRQGHL